VDSPIPAMTTRVVDGGGGSCRPHPSVSIGSGNGEWRDDLGFSDNSLFDTT
jgi:hypothetical protein